MKLEHFTNQYKLSKTLRFKLIPVGKTEEHVVAKQLLAEDEKRAEEYKILKKMMDQYHKIFMNQVLSEILLSSLNEYAELFYKKNLSSEERKEFENIRSDLRKQIGSAFVAQKDFKKLFGKEMITEFLPTIAETEEEKAAIKHFEKFTVYFSGFNENRQNMYTMDGKSTEVAFRTIDQNLAFFLDNAKNAKEIIELLDETKVQQLMSNYPYAFDENIKFYDIEFFNQCLSQSGIDKYNQLIGGFSLITGEKIQGLNECINEYCQKNNTKKPKMKLLYKQILSDRESISFILDEYKSDQEVLSSIFQYFNNGDENSPSLLDKLSQIKALFENLQDYDLSKIFIADKHFTTVSNWYESFRTLQDGFNAIMDEESDKESLKQSEIDKYYEKRANAYKDLKVSSLADVQNYIYHGIKNENKKIAITEQIKNKTEELITNINSAYDKAYSLISSEYKADKKLVKNDDAIALIKELIDSMLALEQFLRIFDFGADGGEKDEIFYSELASTTQGIGTIVSLYNKTRNYITAKPYSNDKIKLNFENVELLSGWDKNKEKAYRNVLLRKDGKYYLAIMDKGANTIFEKTECYDGTGYEKMVYKQIPNAAKYISSKQINPQKPPIEIVDILVKKKENPKQLTAKEITTFIDYVQNDFLVNYPSLLDEKGESYFDFKFKNPEEYQTIGEFFDDVDKQSYSVKFRAVSEEYINKMVEEGKLYLFEIYSKDFSEFSKGTPNLHTMYFKLLFSDINKEQRIFALNGGAEMFYRKASLKLSETTVHHANEPIENKNERNEKKQSVFDYDIIKDKRYTKPQFNLHMPITINYNSTDGKYVKLNNYVREELKISEECNIIGIDRGERNLIYVSVIDKNGNILEQKSLNIIGNTDYQQLLDKREKENLEAKKSWTTVQGIKNLKEGYVSLAVHEICTLIEKYEAIVVMEDLNSGFKNSRKKVEKQVYQKFEKMLIDKLNYYGSKSKELDEMGSVMNGYQLTNKFESFQKMGKQNGILFYIPAWLTSKIDPTTGFVDLLKPKYKNIGDSRAFFEKFDDIRYNEDEKYFEFTFNYDNFPGGTTSYRKVWTVCTNGERIQTFRNKEKNSNWEQKTVDISREMAELFTKYDIDFKNGDLKTKIAGMNEKEFFAKLISLLGLTLQMRNSVTNGKEDYLISPVKNNSGEFYNPDIAAKNNMNLPLDADANGAYHIALKGLWAVNEIKKCEDVSKVKLAISNAQWLEFTQGRFR